MSDTTIAYLGPVGTFTEQAMRTLVAVGEVIELPTSTVGDAIAAVRTGAATSAVVPLENSVEGAVGATLDSLIDAEPLHIRREVVLRVDFGLYARPGTELSAVKTIASHPHAEAQCRGWLSANLREAAFIRTASTADAAAAVSRGEYAAAICAAVAGQEYRLTALALGIADNRGASTRFIQVAKPGPLPAPTGADVTSLVVTLSHTAGSLAEAVTQFAIRGVNLTRIESRPTKQQLGRYHFFLDCSGHIADPDVAEALAGLHRSSADIRFLGSYPRTIPEFGTPSGSNAYQTFSTAAAWINELRAGRPT